MKSRSAVLVLVAIAGLSCKARASSPAPGDAAAEAAKASGTAAVMDGASITLAEIDAKVKGKLAVLEQDAYEARKNALDEMVSEKLIQREAAARGVAKEELLQKEINEKVSAPTATEAKAFFAANSGRMGGRSYDQMASQIMTFLTQSAAQQRASVFQKELAAKYKLKVSLQAPRFPVTVQADAQTKGAASAPVTIVEYADYQCPYCQRAEETVESVMSKYSGKVRLVLADFPLDGHPGALPAARAARCAGEQGKFWEYHKDLLTTPGEFSEKDFKTRASSLGLKSDAFAACFASDRHDAAIKKSVENGLALGVQATPTFFINGRYLSGARSPEAFEAIIDEEIASGGR